MLSRLRSTFPVKNLINFGNHGKIFVSSFSTLKVDPKSIDYSSLGFSYVPTKSCILLNYKDGQWEKNFTVSDDPYIKIHVLANVLHYGQALFEGLKAFHTKDNKVNLFNPQENVRRLSLGAKRMAMPEVDGKMFIKMMEEVVKRNIDFVPPYGSGGALYLRPFYFGNGCQLGLGAAKEYTFGIVSCPVGEYYKGGLKAVDALVVENYDRAAPKGVGNVKTAGNYAADILPAKETAAKGFPICLYLDAAEHKYIEEFSTSNFIGISKDKKKFIQPNSRSTLESITAKMIQKLAEDMGLTVEHRKVDYAEVESGGFSEIAACGTAVVVTPIKSITRGEKKVTLGFDPEKSILRKLYDNIRKIQNGEAEDKYKWAHYVCDKKM